MMGAPVVILPCSSKAAYLRRYAEDGQGLDRPRRGPLADAVLAHGRRDGEPADPPDRDRRGPGQLLHRRPAGQGRRGARGVRHPRRPRPGRRDHDRPPRRAASGRPARRAPARAASSPTSCTAGAGATSGAEHDGGRGRAAARVGKLQALVRIPTVSYREPERIDTAAFDAFVEELARQFPLLHERLELTRVHTHGLLFHWRGASAERPVVLMAHLDVVPVEGDWQHGAFSGDVVDGEVWGRGTLDDKGSWSACARRSRRLLERDLTPAQDVWLSFGCDEEVFGQAAPSSRSRS